MALLTYPTEWSYLSSAANRWLYNRSAHSYEKKWERKAYVDPHFDDMIRYHVARGLAQSGVNHVLDLGCGTGRGIRLLAPALPQDTQYSLVDFSPAMLQQLQEWLNSAGTDLATRACVSEQDLGNWSGQAPRELYGAVLLLEVGEFLPRFRQLIAQLGRVTSPSGSLLMTRPAGLWHLCFPGRGQSRKKLSGLLEAAGFETPLFLPWRGRYELVFSRKCHEQLKSAA